MSNGSSNGNMGLKGRWSGIMNIGAVTLICLMFYQDRHTALEAAKEDRRMFREELHRLHEDSARQWEAIRKLTAAIRNLMEESKKLHEDRK